VIAAAPAAPDYGPPPAVDPPDATLWIPHPVCAWAPAAEAAALLARYEGEEPVRVQADGFEPAVLGAPGEAVVLEPAAPRAEVVVVAWPGDAVRVGDRAVPVNAAGVAVVELAPGPVQVEVRGGGRAARTSTYAPDGHVVWVSLPEPEPHAVYFGSGSGALDARGRAFIAEVAAAAGEARFRLVGWSSPEGNPGANARLSRQRAEVVLEALAAGGVPRERITIVDSVVAGADEPAERARRVDIVAVGPEIP
jgi:outer membrane protein OmpA-like peptidoglycan-associated protein